MKCRTRVYYSAEQRAEMWNRWQRGESINSIGRAFDRGHSSISGQFIRAGGLRGSLGHLRASPFRHLSRPASAQEDQPQSGELHKVVEGVVCEVVRVHGDLCLLNDGGNKRQ